jgi:hypothetical protein
VKTYIVPWEKVVKADFLEEFINITRDLIFAGSDPEARAQVMKRLPAEKREEYLRCRGLMMKCGYELRDPGDVGRWRGWNAPYLDGEEIKFKTTAEPGRIYISLRDFVSYKHLCDLPEDKELDVTALLKKLAEHMAVKYERTL